MHLYLPIFVLVSRVNYTENMHFIFMSILHCYKSKAFQYDLYKTFNNKLVECKFLVILIDIKCYEGNLKETRVSNYFHYCSKQVFSKVV